MTDVTDRPDFYRVMVAIETDATRYYGPDASRPALLEATQAEQMLAHLAADMQALLPDISRCGLIAAGALYDQTQVLRPGYPVFAALEATATPGAGRFQPGLVSIGGTGGRMPVDDLQPFDDIPLGMLQLLPLSIHGPAPLVTEIGHAMEYRFLEEGQVSAHSASWLAAAFGVSVNHARLMTLTDLNALLRLQLEHFGFLPLWDLLDAALAGREDALAVTTPSGQTYEWRESAVHTDFQTFDYWAARGGGADLPAGRLALAEAYADHTREMRQYLTTLGAHGLTVQFHLPGAGDCLEGSFFREVSEAATAGPDPTVTEHSLDGLGTVAITVTHGGMIENYYPLSPGGLNDIHACLRDRVAGGHTVAFPGTLVYDETTRRLRPDAADHPPGGGPRPI
jgi:hypothetical protein